MNLISKIKESRPFVIAGPCAVETPEQMNEFVIQAQTSKVFSLLRGGIWKPRTRPNSFEGIGETGLPWLVEAGKTLNIPTCTEVANAKHVEMAIKGGIDVLWIGARTSVNPFAVQEIADALAGTNIPIMVKNPVNPDLDLWIGAFERLAQAGCTELVAIHRGFSVYKHPKYRNVPSWELPLSFRERLPEISMINDPSHITGNRALLLEVAQKAMDLNFDGLMIETHPTPNDAWSDAAQQIKPEELKQLLDKLILRKTFVNETIEDQLNLWREKIGVLDDRLFEILMSRMKLSEELGSFKKENHVTIFQETHWKRMISSRLVKSEDYHLTKRFVRQIMDALHQESIRHQMRIMNQNEEDE